MRARMLLGAPLLQREWIQEMALMLLLVLMLVLMRAQTQVQEQVWPLARPWVRAAWAFRSMEEYWEIPRATHPLWQGERIQRLDRAAFQLQQQEARESPSTPLRSRS